MGTLFRSILLIAGLWAIGACQSGSDEVAPSSAAVTTDATVAVQWMDLFLDLERYAPGYRPPVAARSLGYISLVVYETVVPGSAEYHSFVDRQTARPDDASR